jgi:hypothetical protein
LHVNMPQHNLGLICSNVCNLAINLQMYKCQTEQPLCMAKVLHTALRSLFN